MKAPYWLPNLLLTALSLLALLAGAEVLARIAENQPPWPGYAFDSVAGFLHDRKIPGINSFGFIDKERSEEKPKDCYRVILLGDSFVDGTPLAQRFQEALQEKAGTRKVEVIPMGISGCGTVNQLTFFEEFGRKLRPDLVIVLFVPNDFANNSNILEAVRLRFHPERPGRPFLGMANGSIHRIAPSVDYEKWLLKELPPHPQQGILRLPEAFLERTLGSSKAYQYIKSKLLLLDAESLYHRFDGEYAYRLSQLRAIPAAAAAVEGWQYPQDLDMDAMFLVDGESIPRAFHDALDYTAWSLAKLKGYAAEDGFTFLLVATDSCTFFPESWLKDWRPSADRSQRTLNPANFIRRVNAVATTAGVNFLDLYPGFSTLPDIRKAHLPNDNHWSELGHQLAGKYMADHVAVQGWLRQQ